MRRRHLDDGAAYLEIHVATPLEACAKRDVKGLYANQAAGAMIGLTGVDAPYEPPRAPDLTLRTESQTVAESVSEVFDLLVERKFAR